MSVYFALCGTKRDDYYNKKKRRRYPLGIEQYTVEFIEIVLLSKKMPFVLILKTIHYLDPFEFLEHPEPNKLCFRNRHYIRRRSVRLLFRTI